MLKTVNDIAPDQTAHFRAVNRAFSRQSAHYDEDDRANPILQAWRQRVYDHVGRFLKPDSYMLELNAGTGIDALHFVRKGHRVHATDLSNGMISQIRGKIETNRLEDVLTCQQCSYDHLNRVEGRTFDYIFSNFGGLNCIDDLSKVTRHFPVLLRAGGHITLVIMPPVCLWEWLWIFKGHGRKAFRRLRKGGIKAHLEGEHFTTWYHTLSTIEKAMGRQFTLVAVEGLGSVSPPPSKYVFAEKYPGLYKLLWKMDCTLSAVWPFNRSADHLVVTFRFGFGE